MPSVPKLPNVLDPSPALRFRELRVRVGMNAAALHRRRLGHVQFIGVTGSCGKTTTKELIDAVLASELRGRKTPRGRNDRGRIAQTVLRTTARDRYCVVEVAAGDPLGLVESKTRMLRPNIGVVTSIGGDHRTVFRTLDATAAEKRALVEGVAAGGTAILNADDPRVLAMAQGLRCRVITVGCSAGATLRARDVRSSWPERLAFTLEANGRALPVQTRLCGRHWVTAALAALAVGTVMGISLDHALEALAGFDPLPGRMRPLHRDGITFIQDDTKSPFWSLDTAFTFLAEARARRRIAVIGSVSDYSGSSSKMYAAIARRALAVADEVVLIGPYTRSALKAGGDAVHAFPNADAAAPYLQSTLREGDLVLVKGSERVDQLERIIAGSH